MWTGYSAKVHDQIRNTHLGVDPDFNLVEPDFNLDELLAIELRLGTCSVFHPLMIYPLRVATSTVVQMW